jgi:hypothetical protein
MRPEIAHVSSITHSKLIKPAPWCARANTLSTLEKSPLMPFDSP